MIATVLLSACGASAQTTIVVPTPVETLTAPPPDVSPTPAAETIVEEIVGEGELVPIDMSLDYSMQIEPREMNIEMPALTESSGTWLRRGWWYGGMELVFLQRTWDSAPVLLAFDNATGRGLNLLNSNPGREEAARVTLGRFLFRDIHNRDHSTEFVYFGGGEFGQNSVVVADDPATTGGILVFGAVDGGIDVSFDGGEVSSVEYDSRLNSFEWKYVLTSRMQRDRMELQPDGRWLRRANKGWTYHADVGLRYIDLTERINWTATGIDNPAITQGAVATEADGRYRVRTENDMVGPQLGGGLTYESDRFNVTFAGNVGVLANNVSSNSRLAFTATADGTAITDDGVGFAKGDRDNTLSFLGQFKMTGRWHLRPHLSLKASYEVMLLTATGLAPYQLDFSPADGRVTVTGDNFYHGISMGFEGYW